MEQNDELKKREAYLITLSEKICDYMSGRDFHRSSKPEQVFFCIWQLEAEVNNGGFSQYFFNAGKYANETITALEEIGAFYTAGLLRKAVAIFPEGKVPSDLKARQDIVAAMNDAAEEQLDALDVLFYEYKDNLSQLLYDFTLKHKAMIRGAQG